MSLLRVYTHNNIKRCSYLRNCVFCHFIDLRYAPCHLYVRTHTLASNVALICATTQNRGRQVTHRIEVDKSCLLYVRKHTLTSSIVLICATIQTELRETNSCHFYVHKYTLTSNVAPNYVCIHTLTSNIALILRSYVFCHLTDLR